MKQRENCNRSANNREWSICCQCDGRVHNPECTTRRRKEIDCCDERHQMLHDAGQTVGIHDESVPMLESKG